MPVTLEIGKGPPINQPTENYTLVKYLDLTKFLSLLSRKGLFFCRLDKLEDQFEGTTSRGNYLSRVNVQKHLRATGFFCIEMSDDDIIKQVEAEYKSEVFLKSIFCVNCWNKNQFESAALWKIYADFNKGIMIRSSVDRIIKSLNNCTQEIFMGEVSYIDYQNDTMPDGNIFFPTVHKHRSYSYEEEVRLIHFKDSPNGYNYDWTKEEVEEGIYVPADLNVLVDEIILSPFAPDWYFNLIKDICNKFELQKEIKYSILRNAKNGV